MTTKSSKIPSFGAAEFIDNDHLQLWRVEVLEEFFRQCPEAFGELTGPRVLGRLRQLEATARLAAIDDGYRRTLLEEYSVVERRVSLAVFTCFSLRNGRHAKQRITASHLRDCDEDHLPDLLPFRNEFLAWLSEYNLAVDWVIDALLDFLRSFEQYPELYKNGFHGDRDRSGWVASSPPFEFSFRPFELTVEHLAPYLDRLRSEFESAIALHKEAIERIAIDRGLERAGAHESAHFVWLVCRVCRRMTFPKIVEYEKARSGTLFSEEAIKKAVARLMKEIGLP